MPAALLIRSYNEFIDKDIGLSDYNNTRFYLQLPTFPMCVSEIQTASCTLANDAWLSGRPLFKHMSKHISCSTSRLTNVADVAFVEHDLPISDPFKKSATPNRVPIQSARMKGLLLPHRRVQRSLAEPIRGVNIRPRTGLRNHVRL